MKIIPLFCIGAGLVFCTSCSIFPEPEQTETYYYDLSIPNRIAIQKPIEVIPFSSMTGERFRMACREKNNIIRGNEFHKWVQTPGSLLTKYLRLAFRNNSDETGKTTADTIVVSGSVLLFEMLNGYAELGVRYQIQYGTKGKINKTVLIREKLSGSTPCNFAEAMSRAADQFAQQLAKEVQSLIDQEAAGKK